MYVYTHITDKQGVRETCGGMFFEIRQVAHQNTIIISLDSRKEMEYNRSATVKGAQRLDVIFVPSIQAKKISKEGHFSCQIKALQALHDPPPLPK